MFIGLPSKTADKKTCYEKNRALLTPTTAKIHEKENRTSACILLLYMYYCLANSNKDQSPVDQATCNAVD